MAAVGEGEEELEEEEEASIGVHGNQKVRKDKTKSGAPNKMDLRRTRNMLRKSERGREKEKERNRFKVGELAKTKRHQIQNKGKKKKMRGGRRGGGRRRRRRRRGKRRKRKR